MQLLRVNTIMSINLTPEQAKQLNETGECWTVEPMKTQPVEVFVGINVAPDLKYQPGQKVKVKIDIDYDVSTHKEYKVTMPAKQILDCIVKEVEVKRVQDINFEKWLKIISTKEIGVKEWFNEQFSQAMPVYCTECAGAGRLYQFGNSKSCPSCNGDGISHYICYAYNDKIIIQHNTWEGKPLQIIVNPWCYLIRLGK